LRSALAERLQQLAITYYEAMQSSALQTRILRDVDAINGLCRHLLHTGLNGLLVIIYFTSISLVRQPILALYFLLTVPAGIGLLKHFDRRFREQYQLLRLENEQTNIRHAHRIVVLNAGRIVEAGTYEQLPSRQGHSAKLVNVQAVTKE